MLEIAGGILIAVVVLAAILLILPLIIRPLLWTIPIALIGLTVLFFYSTEYGRMLFPAVVAANILGGVIWAVSCLLDRRREEEVRRTGWRRID